MGVQQNSMRGIFLPRHCPAQEIQTCLFQSCFSPDFSVNPGKSITGDATRLPTFTENGGRLRWNLFSYRDLWEWINRPFDTPRISGDSGRAFRFEQHLAQPNLTKGAYS
jgi:hypothetical protein